MPGHTSADARDDAGQGIAHMAYLAGTAEVKVHSDQGAQGVRPASVIAAVSDR